MSIPGDCFASLAMTGKKGDTPLDPVPQRLRPCGLPKWCGGILLGRGRLHLMGYRVVLAGTRVNGVPGFLHAVCLC